MYVMNNVNVVKTKMYDISYCVRECFIWAVSKCCHLMIN
jgi:hypothetical protein